MFNIGDKVFMATYGRNDKFVTCPDCLGSKQVKVVLGDGTEILIECGGCDPGGYQCSTGRIRQYDYSVEAIERTVTGVKTTMSGTEYELDNFGGCSYYTGDQSKVFATEELAIAAVNLLKQQFEDEENKRLMAKTKDHKSWAWNATYHRRCIKDLERQLEHHRTKVEICATKKGVEQ